MKMTFRWYGENDPVKLSYIRQIPNMSGVVTAVYDCGAGGAWTEESVLRIKNLSNAAGLDMEVIESVPVHEDIKLGKKSRDKYIQNYIKNIKTLGSAGVKCVCYNFMPVFDWLRTSLDSPNPDGSDSLSFDDEQMKRLDPKKLSLPGWDESYTKEQLSGLLDEYKTVTHEMLFSNLIYFLENIMPACREAGIDMAIHPDDPPWDIFGLPRIITDEANIDKLFKAVPSKHNGLTFCSGSLGAGRANDLAAMAAKYAKEGRIKFAHLRNILYLDGAGFKESAHYSSEGSLDMYKIIKALTDNGFDGYVRPDHGRNIWGEKGRPGYGLYDRALGAAYLNGLFEAAYKEKDEN